MNITGPDLNVVGTDWIAVYAAIVATATFAWRIFEWLNKKPAIKLKMCFMRMRDCPGVPPTKQFISVAAMNTGHFATTIRRAGFRLSDKTDLQNMDSLFVSKTLPRRLNPGESVDVYYDEESLRESIRGKGLRIEFAWFQDEADRLYKGKPAPPVRKALE